MGLKESDSLSAQQFTDTYKKKDSDLSETFYFGGLWLPIFHSSLQRPWGSIITLMPTETPMRFMPIGPTTDLVTTFETFPERAEYDKFYTAYGEYFSVWSEVEVKLFAVFVILLQSPNYASEGVILFGYVNVA